MTVNALERCAHHINGLRNYSDFEIVSRHTKHPGSFPSA